MSTDETQQPTTSRPADPQRADKSVASTPAAPSSGANQSTLRARLTIEWWDSREDGMPHHIQTLWARDVTFGTDEFDLVAEGQSLEEQWLQNRAAIMQYIDEGMTEAQARLALNGLSTD